MTLAPAGIVPMHYRIPELETDADKPKDLGEIERWLQRKENVIRLDGNTHSFNQDMFEKKPQIFVFKHDARITR